MRQTQLRILATQNVRAVHEFFALSQKRAWGMPGARRTRSLVCAWGSEYAHEYSQRVRRDHPASPRNGLRLMAYSPRRSGFLASVAPEKRLLLTNLTPASRRQDHTSSPSASMPFVIGTSSVHRIPPRVRDDREPPLRWDGTAGISEVIWVGRKGEIFLRRGLDRESVGGGPARQLRAAAPQARRAIPRYTR